MKSWHDSTVLRSNKRAIKLNPNGTVSVWSGERSRFEEIDTEALALLEICGRETSVHPTEAVASFRQEYGISSAHEEDCQTAIQRLIETGLLAEPFELNEVSRKPVFPSYRNTPVIAVGSIGADVSILGRHLDKHDNFAVLAEPVYLLNLLRIISFNLPLPVRPGDWFGKGEDYFFTRREVINRYSRLVDDLFHARALKVSAKRWVACSDRLCRSLDLVDQVFDFQAKFVCLVRNGVAVAKRMEQDSNRTCEGGSLVVANEAFEHALRLWAEQVRQITGFGDRAKDRCLLVRHEELDLSPAQTVARIVDFIGEQPQQVTLTGDATSSETAEQEVRLSAEQASRWGAVVNRSLQRAGYKTI